VQGRKTAPKAGSAAKAAQEGESSRQLAERTYHNERFSLPAGILGLPNDAPGKTAVFTISVLRQKLAMATFLWDAVFKRVTRGHWHRSWGCSQSLQGCEQQQRQSPDGVV
jgi:hypothetical protein